MGCRHLLRAYEEAYSPLSVFYAHKIIFSIACPAVAEEAGTPRAWARATFVQLAVSRPLEGENCNMAVPKRKTSRMKRGMRRSADALQTPTYVEDKESGERRRPHHIDLKTGKYKGRQILPPKSEV